MKKKEIPKLRKSAGTRMLKADLRLAATLLRRGSLPKDWPLENLLYVLQGANKTWCSHCQRDHFVPSGVQWIYWTRHLGGLCATHWFDLLDSQA